MVPGYVPFGKMVCRITHDGVQGDSGGGNGWTGKFMGGACRPEPAMLDGLIATMLINEDLPPRPNEVFAISPVVQESIIRQSWISQLQLAESQSCGQEPAAGQCFCVSTLGKSEKFFDVAKIATCIPATDCTANHALGWTCNAAADPLTTMILSNLLQEHATETLIQWTMAAGFAQPLYSQQQAETDLEYRTRLVQMLADAHAAGRFEDVGYGYGVLSKTDHSSAAYARDHSCPANSYFELVLGEARSVSCLPCPDGKEAPAGSTTVSACTTKGQKPAAVTCVSQHTGCNNGCAMVPVAYRNECGIACMQRCSNCVRATDPNRTEAEVAEQCGSTGTGAHVPMVPSVGTRSFSHASGTQRRQDPQPNDDSDDIFANLARCQTVGRCLSLEIDGALPFIFPYVFTAIPPNQTDAAWRFFSPPGVYD